MTVRLYNSLTRKVSPLEPRTPGVVQMFVCGPTVYDRVHLGNARTFTVFDVLTKWLRHRGLDVTYLQNITDIDDKILRRAAEHGRDPLEYAHEYDDLFRADMLGLGNNAVSQFARATDHIAQVIAQVHTLIDKGSVYCIDGDGWYYDLSTFPDYGKLSGRTGLAADDAVSRIDDSDKKRNSGDFCVWKSAKPGEPSWPDERLGDGRPGWHIEDTAITEHYFGAQYDVHGGGMDLKFPHHEAEIAQQEAASGLVPFVRHWMHVGFLQVNAKRMGKSEGNFEQLHSLLERYEPAVLRFFLLSNHYRSPLDFNEQSLAAAQAAVNRIREVMLKLTPSPTSSDALGDAPATALNSITESMDDDLNTPAAFAALFEFIRSLNAVLASGPLSPVDVAAAQNVFSMVSNVFGIIPSGGAALPDDIQKLVDERHAARERKDWASSDELRDRIAGLGYTVDDTPYGPLVKPK
jgi:cysteinyl-tRNA synthetase